MKSRPLTPIANTAVASTSAVIMLGPSIVTLARLSAGVLV